MLNICFVYSAQLVVMDVTSSADVQDERFYHDHGRHSLLPGASQEGRLLERPKEKLRYGDEVCGREIGQPLSEGMQYIGVVDDCSVLKLCEGLGHQELCLKSRLFLLVELHCVVLSSEFVNTGDSTTELIFRFLLI